MEWFYDTGIINTQRNLFNHRNRYISSHTGLNISQT